MTTNRIRIACLSISAAAATLLAGCAGAPASGFGPTVLTSLIEKATPKVLNRLPVGGGKTPRIAFVGIENNSGYTIGDNVGFVYESVATQFSRSDKVSGASYRFVQERLAEAGIARPSQLALKAPREKFLAGMGEGANAPDYLMWAMLTSVSRMDGGSGGEKYQLTMVISEPRTWDEVVRDGAVYPE